MRRSPKLLTQILFFFPFSAKTKGFLLKSCVYSTNVRRKDKPSGDASCLPPLPSDALAAWPVYWEQEDESSSSLQSSTRKISIKSLVNPRRRCGAYFMIKCLLFHCSELWSGLNSSPRQGSPRYICGTPMHSSSPFARKPKTAFCSTFVGTRVGL